MFRSRLSALPSRLVLVSALAGLSLAGCNQGASNTAGAAANVAAAPDGALPLVATDVALVPAPSASQLPPAPPPRIGRVASASDAYAFADRAAEMSRAFADAPPDYTYDDEGVRPWVWRTRDGYERVAEAVPGGERYYYYEPGSDEPFYVQDPDYGYGFDGGMLVVVYDHAGRQLPPDAARADWAGRYLLRARALYEGAQQQPHEGVSANNWQSHRDAIAAQDRQWQAEQQSDADWRAYHDAHDTQEEAHWQAERLQRLTWAAAVDQTINDPERAQRDWRAAQAEAQSTGQPPPPSLASIGRPGPLQTVNQPSPSGHAPESPYAAPPAGMQNGQASLAAQQAAAQAGAAADHAAASREAAARAKLAQQQAAAAQSQANLARQQADAAQKAQALQEQASRAAQQQASAAAQADLARRQQAAAVQAQAAEKAREAQAQAAHQAQQQAAAAQADANLARRQQAAAAQAQAQAAQKARAAQQQAQPTAAHVASGGPQGQHPAEGTPAEHKPARHPASNAAQEKPTQ